MKITIDSVDALPEALRSLVETKDGKSTLDLSVLSPTSTLNEVKTKLVTATSDVDRAKADLAAFRSLGFGATPDEIKNHVQGLAKTAPEHEAVIRSLKEAHEREKNSLQEQLSSVRTSWALADVKAALSAAGVVPEGVDLIAERHRNRISFSDEGQVRFLQKDESTPMIGSGNDGFARVDDFAQELAKSYPTLIADKGKGGGGTPPNGSSKSEGPSTKMSREEFNKLPPAQRADAMEKGVEFITT